MISNWDKLASDGGPPPPPDAGGPPPIGAGGPPGGGPGGGGPGGRMEGDDGKGGDGGGGGGKRDEDNRDDDDRGKGPGGKGNKVMSTVLRFVDGALIKVYFHRMTFHAAAATALIENRGSAVLYIDNSTMKERGEFTSSRRSLCRIAICSGVRIGRSCVRRNRHESLVNPNFCRKNTSFFLELSKNIDIFFPLLSQFSFIPDKMFLIYHCVLFTLNI